MLLVGALLAPGKRTVTTLLRVNVSKDTPNVDASDIANVYETVTSFLFISDLNATLPWLLDIGRA